MLELGNERGLMLGDLVEYQGGIYKVAMLCDWVEEDEESWRTVVALHDKDGVVSVPKRDLKNLWPIKLTDEILAANGWEHYDKGVEGELCYVEHWRYATAPELYLEVGEYGYTLDIAGFQCGITNVHTLQHLLRFLMFGSLADSIKVEE